MKDKCAMFLINLFNQLDTKERLVILKMIQEIDDLSLLEEIFKFSKTSETLFYIYSRKDNNECIYCPFNAITRFSNLYKSNVYDKYFCIRQAIANNLNISESIKEEIASDKNLIVAVELLNKKDITYDLLYRILNSFLVTIPISHIEILKKSSSLAYSWEEILRDILLNPNFQNFNIFNEIPELIQYVNSMFEFYRARIVCKFKLKDYEPIKSKVGTFIVTRECDITMMDQDQLSKFYFDAKKSISGTDFNYIDKLIFKSRYVDPNILSKKAFKDIIENDKNGYNDHSNFCPFPELIDYKLFPRLMIHSNKNIVLKSKNPDIDVLNYILSKTDDFISDVLNILDNTTIDFSLLKESILEKVFNLINEEISPDTDYNIVLICDKVLASPYAPDKILIEKSKIRNIYIQLALLKNPKFIEEVYKNLVKQGENNYIREIASNRLEEKF